MQYTVKAPGSCGELVQGTLNGNHFLITCPVNIFSTVELKTGQTGPHFAGAKTLLAIQRTQEYFGRELGPYQVTVHTELHPGKGMASSSADISAACQAAALALGEQLSADQIADIALTIEPSDGIFYPGITMFDHVRGKLRRYLGHPPALRVVIFDAGGEVDTLHFNQRADLSVLNRTKEPLIQHASELVIQGLAAGDCRLIGQGATMSARANQTILYKPCLEEFIELGARYGAVGVNAAHSGTVIGLLFPQESAQHIPACLQAAKTLCPEVTYLRTADLVSGGLVILEGEESEKSMSV